LENQPISKTNINIYSIIIERIMTQFSKQHLAALEEILNKNPINTKKIISIVEANKPSDRSLLVRYSLARSMLREHTKNEKLLNDLLPPKEISDTVANESRIRRDTKKRIKVSDRFINTIMDFQGTENVYEQFLFLLFITGRRTGELITAKFSSKSKSKHITIKGVLKRRDTTAICSFEPLISKRKTLHYLKKLQRQLKSMHDYKEKTFRRMLNIHCKRLLGTNCNPHMLRGVYVTYLYEFRNDENLKINTFIMKHLCHEGINTSLSYTGYELLFKSDIIKG
jgi:integrase